MATGSDGYKGLAVPLYGDCEIIQRTAATDMMTITGKASQSGDYFVCRDVSASEKFVVDVSGNTTVAGTLAVTGASTITGIATFTASPVFNGTILTTAPTTGLTTGELFFYDAANVRQVAMAKGATTFWYQAMTDN